jgi:hypothetical protein
LLRVLDILHKVIPLRNGFLGEFAVVLRFRQPCQCLSELHQIEVNAHDRKRFLVGLVKPLRRNFDAFELPQGDKIGRPHQEHDDQKTSSQPWPYVQAPGPQQLAEQTRPR